MYRGELPKKGGLGQCAYFKGGLAKKRGWCFLGEVDTPMHTITAF